MFFSGCVHLLPLAVFSSVRTEVKIRELEKKVETLKQQKVTKDDYKKENPDVKLMGDSKLLMPKNINDKPIILPLPKPVDDEEEWNAID